VNTSPITDHPEDLGRCPVCKAPAGGLIEEVHGFDLVECSGCGLQYTANARSQIERYAMSYEGKPGILDDARPYVFPATRLALEAAALWRPPPYLTVAERWVIDRIRGSLPKGCLVLDIGCGTGRFLDALRRRGYRTAGIEPVEGMAAALRARGYDVRTQQLPRLSWDEPPPSAVTLFEVLEHLPEPMPALEELRRQFPCAPIGASVPSPTRVGLERGERGGSDHPPNHFLRWNPEALEQAFTRAGYRRVLVHAPSPAPNELAPGIANIVPPQVFRRLQGCAAAPPARSLPADGLHSPATLGWRLSATALLLGHRVLRLAGGVAAAPRSLQARRRGRSSASLAIWAEP
jgi:SAM-dependent methyltransferase